MPGINASYLLDILGNENRRRIIRLLADRPAYVTEISEKLNVAPKSVINHLNMLENAGIIKSSLAECRRKYYSISHSARLEISLSPYTYTITMVNTDMLQLIQNEADSENIENYEQKTDKTHIRIMKKICRDLETIREDQKELSRLQKELDIQTDILIHEFIKSASYISGDDLDTDILFRILKHHLSISMLCDCTGESTENIYKRLQNLEKIGVVDKYQNRTQTLWCIKKETEDEQKTNKTDQSGNV